MSTICLYNGTVYTGITVLPKSTVIIKDGIIDDVISNERFKTKKLPKDKVIYYLNGANVTGGFIDTHIHGIGGFDTSDGSPESILNMSKMLVDFGVTGFCPTLYPNDEETFIKNIEAVADAVGREKGAKILGLHLEGPFVSRDKRGVLNPRHMRQVDLKLMERFSKASRGHIAIMTVAPELKNMRELAHFCLKNRIVLSAGHSNATYEQMLEGMQAGIVHSTHFFNAMRRLHHRDPGVVGSILIHPEVSCEIIADGYHLHPAILKLLMRVKPINKIVLVTDALKPTEQYEGTLYANNEEVYFEDGVFRTKNDGTIAGSSLTMIRGVKKLSKLGIHLEDAVKMANNNPAILLNIQKNVGSLIPGKDADVVVFDHDFNVMISIIKGEVKKFAE